MTMEKALRADSASPLYRQLMQRIRADIASGVYPVHSRIPSEAELGESYQVSRVTVLKALAELTREGLLRRMQGKGTTLRCNACGKEWELTEEGEMRALTGETEFSHIPDWYRWERDCVRRQIEQGEYSLDVPVDIYMLIDTKALYRVGEGRLQHTTQGFCLTGCDGKLKYAQKPLASYSLNSDYYGYEIGDVIGIGNTDVLYYCFPKTDRDVVAKARLATEELYRMALSQKQSESKR
jgi:DNA-binding transcriptional regulator YhcF (GntR family)